MDFKNAFVAIFKEILQTVLISLAIFFFVYVFLVQPHRVKGDSMIPNFTNGELLLTEKVSYRFGEPKRGDVIVFHPPGNPNVDYIKRIVGLPGEIVSVKDGAVYVNGNRLSEPYETQLTQGNGEQKLAENEFFVLGDNRRSSQDSRMFGSVERDSIRGRVWVVYWPVVMKGDSRGPRLISRVNYSVFNSF